MTSPCPLCHRYRCTGWSSGILHSPDHQLAPVCNTKVILGERALITQHQQQNKHNPVVTAPFDELEKKYATFWLVNYWFYRGPVKKHPRQFHAPPRKLTFVQLHSSQWPFKMILRVQKQQCNIYNRVEYNVSSCLQCSAALYHLTVIVLWSLIQFARILP